MRRTLTRSAALSSAVLAAVVVLAGPAEARRNVGGTIPAGSACIKPGVINLGDQALSSTPCICYANEEGRFHALGRGDCPAGIPEIKIDRRNVGG